MRTRSIVLSILAVAHASIALIALAGTAGEGAPGMGGGLRRAMLRDTARVCGLPFGGAIRSFGLEFGPAVLTNVVLLWGVVFLIVRRGDRRRSQALESSAS